MLAKSATAGLVVFACLTVGIFLAQEPTHETELATRTIRATFGVDNLKKKVEVGKHGTFLIINPDPCQGKTPCGAKVLKRIDERSKKHDKIIKSLDGKVDKVMGLTKIFGKRLAERARKQAEVDAKANRPTGVDIAMKKLKSFLRRQPRSRRGSHVHNGQVWSVKGFSGAERRRAKRSRRCSCCRRRRRRRNRCGCCSGN